MRSTLLVLIIALALVTAGCETMRGLGRDMQKAGNWVEREAAR